mmetsp:Transcript_19540/g.29153  ORF Transcript_19540/g.29153 Transcript_19540/m.29153 type:complete len:418 (-) Transcript_19540:73-1326(-)
MENLSVGFNQDSSLITVGSSRGFSVYRCNPFKKCFQHVDGSIKHVEMLFSTSLVALVGSGKQTAFSPRRIRMFNTKTQKYICELDFAATILNVKMNRSRLIAVLETKIHIFDLETLDILHTLPTPPNKKGIVALSSNIKKGYMVSPGHDSQGKILVYDVINLQVRSSINACNNPLQILSMNAEGTMVAAASTQGTVIRVFSIPSGTKLHTFRRGSLKATIHSISFNADSSRIAVSSNSRTIHIFELKDPQDKKKSTPNTASAIKSYLPNVLSDIVEPGRHFAFVNLKDNTRSVVAFNKDELIVLSSRGHFCRYTIPKNGGECKLRIEYPLIEKPDEEVGVKIHGKSSQPVYTGHFNDKAGEKKSNGSITDYTAFKFKGYVKVSEDGKKEPNKQIEETKETKEQTAQNINGKFVPETQ